MTTGFRHSPSTRARMAAAHTGKRHPPEVRSKISLSNRGKHCREISAKQRAAVSAANKGRLFTDEHSELISIALLKFYARTHPCGPAERARREQRRVYKRALRARRRATKS
jgi:NUMOD3 motif